MANIGETAPRRWEGGPDLVQVRKRAKSEESTEKETMEVEKAFLDSI